MSVADYNITWTTPSLNALGSMPLGNGDIGLNVWVEKEGDLLFYIGRGDAWSEVHRLLKLGRLRIRFDRPLFPGNDFSQTLHLESGCIVIRGGDSEIRIWVDMHRPVIQIDITSASPVGVLVAHEPWRIGEHRITGDELFSAYGQHGKAPTPPTESADQVLPMTEGFPCMGWYHRNEHSIFRGNQELQGMGDWAATHQDPLLSRTFGCLVDGTGFSPAGTTSMASQAPSRHFTLRVAALTAQTIDAAAWITQCRAALTSVSAISDQERFTAHRSWWSEFWERSHVHITGGGNDTRDLSQAWHLYRFLCATQGRGEFPMKFNGGIFNVDIPGWFKDGSDADADFRNWGGAYWHQNTRQLYWPLLASGDADLMRPFFEMYRRNLPFTIERCKRWNGHDGAVFPEIFYIWGAHTDENYGYDRVGKELSDVGNNYIKRHWQGNLETIAMGFDYYHYSGDERFLREMLLPMAEAVITFYDLHYPRMDGRLRMEPAQVMETLWDVVNPTPDIAGLYCALEQLLALPATVAPEFRQRCHRLLSELPPLPVEQVNGDTVLAPAEIVRTKATNVESVALWAVFPYRRAAVTGGDLELGRASFRHRPVPEECFGAGAGYFCWLNDNVFAAHLGLMDEARKKLADRVRYNCGNRLHWDKAESKSCGPSVDFRFPSMCGAGEDRYLGCWTPDLDNLGVVQQTIQAMLLQGYGNKLSLLPAWPKEWDVDFKLHAPGNTVVECVVRQGRMEKLKVTPEMRRKDVDYGASTSPEAMNGAPSLSPEELPGRHL